MKKLLSTTLLAASIVATGVNAGELYLGLNTGGMADNSYDAGRFIGLPDADATTGVFTEFGFSQLLATSIYDTDGMGNLTGGVVDTNIAANLAAAGVPAAGTALDGLTAVSLVSPNCAAGQCDIDALSPLVPPLGTDNEGFLQTWDIQVEYNLIATLGAFGPVYTGGYIEFFFNDFADVNDRSILKAEVTGSNLTAANLDINFDITMAEAGFLFVKQGATFVDVADRLTPGQYASFALDTNVNPPIPTADQLLLVGDKAIRQTTLDGSITAAIPEPASIAMLGLGLLGLGAASRRKK